MQARAGRSERVAKGTAARPRAGVCQGFPGSSQLRLVLQPEAVREDRSSQNPVLDPLNELRELLFVQVLHYLANILRMLASSNEDGIFSLDDHNVLHANCSHKLLRRVNVISFGIENELIFSVDHIRAVAVSAVRKLVFEERRPRSK